jgi:uncharacterized surface protein with fasciclin (FAS1) repeats
MSRSYRLLSEFCVFLLILISAPVVAQLTAVVPADTTSDILSTLSSADSLNMFARELRSSGLADSLREAGPITVFALDNKALAAIPDSELHRLLGSSAAMQFFLANYIVKGKLSREHVETWDSTRTLQGKRVRTEQRNEGTFVNGARLMEEISCTNGTIYVLHTVDPALVEQAVALAKGSVK